jgi:hypothetical protein
MYSPHGLLYMYYSITIYAVHHIVAYLPKSKAVEPEKEPLQGNGCVTRNNLIIVGSCVFCAVRAASRRR